jgi:predicted  nucleic acid-binding Zn-ribbon protein
MSLASRAILMLTMPTMATILLTVGLVGHASNGWAQAAAPPPDVLSALLAEVRGLRAAMEQMASAGPRVQLALGRLQLQEQRVNALVRRLEEIKAKLPSAQRAMEEVGDRLNQLEKVAREAADSEMRRDVESAIPGLKKEAAHRSHEFQRLQADEAALVQEIAAEQNRWTEFNQRLEELERALGGR